MLKGRPVVYRWALSRNVLWLAPWLLLLGWVALQRARGLWMVLVPGLISQAAMILFPGNDTTVSIGLLILLSMHIALAVVWLAARSYYRLVSLPTIAISFIIMTLTAGTVHICNDGVSLTSFLWVLAYAVLSLLIIASLGLARWQSRKAYTPRRFLRSALFATVGLSLLVAVCFVALLILSALAAVGFDQIGSIVGSFLGFVLMTAVGGFAVGLLPFLALAVWHPGFQEAFSGLFRLPVLEPPLPAPVDPLQIEKEISL